MTDYKELISALQNCQKETPDCDNCKYSGTVHCDIARMMGDAVDAIEKLQPKKAHWFDVGSLSCRCSRCGCKSVLEYRFCPNCGARMELEE